MKRLLLYTNANILRKNETKEILHFVNYWKSVKGNVSETLVFDCKLTKYSVLDELDEDKVKFITLRKRNEKLLLETAQIPDDQWQKACLPIPDTFYHRLAQDLPRFERERANSIFRKFINIPGQIVYDGDEFTIKIRKRAHTPILLGMEKLKNGFSVPWLNNKLVRIEWTA